MMANQETSNKSSNVSSNTSGNSTNVKNTNNVKNANKPFNLSFKPASVMPTNMFGTSPAKSVEKIQDSLTDLYNPIKESVGEAMENSSSMVSIPVMIGIGVLIIALILITIFRDQVAYGFQSAWNAIKNAFQPSAAPTDPTPAVDQPSVDTQAIKNMIPSVKEVFNIADNKYKYRDAEPLCKAYGAELATYDQVKEAWDKGADWCNYGWVKGQAAIFPTQESTFNKLQAGPEDQRGACGVTGINGGYFDNPELRFGVNCYGSKPSKSDTDERAQHRQKNLTPGALEYDRKVQGYKSERNEIALSPFNSTHWA